MPLKNEWRNDSSLMKSTLETSDYTSRESLQLFLLPTEKCNFRCVYCYEDFRIGKMSPETIASIINLLRLKGPCISSLQICWFGGEPLIAYDCIQKIMGFVRFEMPRKGGFHFSSTMSTNGFLLSREKLSELIRLGVNDFQISFDGDKDEHDTLRILANGGPTFDRLWQNIIDAHNSYLPFNISIRIHSNQSNSESVKKLLLRLSESLGRDYRFSVFIRPLSKLGSPADSTLPIFLEESESAKVVWELRSFARNLGLNVIEKGEDYICYAADPNSYVIRADGRIAKCTVALYDDWNVVGMLLPDGQMELDSAKINWWTRGLESGNRAELVCPLKGAQGEWIWDRGLVN